MKNMKTFFLIFLKFFIKMIYLLKLINRQTKNNVFHVFNDIWSVWFSLIYVMLWGIRFYLLLKKIVVKSYMLREKKKRQNLQAQCFFK